jgi:hypothetical protein
MEGLWYRFKRFFNIGCQTVTDDAIDLLHKYGKIHSARIAHYGKWRFTVEVETNEGYRVRMSVGDGTSNGITDYDPLSTMWSEHVNHQIKWIQADKVIKST